MRRKKPNLTRVKRKRIDVQKTAKLAREIRALEAKPARKATHEAKTKYSYWTIEKVENGYLLKNAVVTAVFNDRSALLTYVDQNTN